MLSDLLTSVIILCFIYYGLSRPYIALCGVVWVDILKPQNLSFGFLAGKPLSLIITLFFFLSLLFNFKHLKSPNKKISTFLLVIFLCWMTLSTYYAQFQTLAWWKYDFVMKTLVLTIFIPFILDTRKKIDTFIATIIAALSYFLMVGGMRTFLGAGGYGDKLVYSSDGDGGITESSTLAMVSVMSIPLIIYLLKNTTIFLRSNYFKYILYALCFAALLTVIGTYARTGLIGLAVLGGLLFIKSQSKLKITMGLLVCILISIPFISSSWLERMNTIGAASEDSSAFGRIVVWRWTLDFVNEYPLLGGGFYAYKANAGELHRYIEFDETHVKDRQNGKDFHSIYFQVLGELGYIGLLIYLAIIFSCYRLNKHIITSSVDEWQVNLGRTLNVVLAVFCACGAFIGVAYTAWLFYLIGLSASIFNTVNQSR